MDNAGGPSRSDQLDLMLTYEQQAHARTKAERDAAKQQAKEAEELAAEAQMECNCAVLERDAALQRAEQAEANMRDRIRETWQDAKLRVREAQHNEDVAARAMNEENDRHIVRITELEAALAERNRYRHVLAGVHGALMDAGSIPVPDIGEPLDESVRALMAERDASRATAQQDRELHDARSARRIKRIETLEVALTEARRVLRLLRDLVKDGLCGHPDLEDLEGVEDTDEPHDVEACYECRSVACLAEADVVLAQEDK